MKKLLTKSLVSWPEAWLLLGLVASPVVQSATVDAPPQSGPRLMITAPADGAVFRAPASFQVEAIGLGRTGGITDIELLVDGRNAAESHIAFIRPPNPDEPVHHVLDVMALEAGAHTLLVRDLSDLSVASAEVTVRVEDTPPTDPSPTLRILSPASGAILPPDQPVVVEAMGVGRHGGITHVELLVDGVAAAESQIVFIRAPEVDEPVYHSFTLESAPPIGPHELSVREVGNPDLVSPVVPIHIVAPLQAVTEPLLRLTSLDDGTLMLVLTREEQGGTVRIEASTDLLSWAPVGTGWPALRIPVAKSAPEAAPSGPRFYRAVSLAE